MKTNRIYFYILVLVASLLTSVARADVLVLVHGWNANADTWVRSGVAPLLVQHGWHDAGVVIATPQGVSHLPGYPSRVTSKRFYRVHLPSNTPMLLQASHLTSQLAFIQQRHPDESLEVAGHSSGGVVARLVAIKPELVNIHKLITIASPHLGTPRAVQGLEVVDSKPFFCPGPGIDFLKSLFGGNKYDYLKHSRGAMLDLAPAGTGNLIDWLNQQVHPEIQYHSIVHMGLDNLVPTVSQDLKQVPALAGRATTHVIQAPHNLNPGDGHLLLRILAR